MADDVPVNALTLYRGDYRPIQWSLLDGADAPLDVTGWGAHATVRARASRDAVVLHQWTVELGNLTLADAAVTLAVDDVDDWTWDVGHYDLFLVDTAGRAQLLDHGPLWVRT